MRSSSSQPYTSEPSPSRKNKLQSQREYRSKEMDGFSELRDALLLVDPFDAPLGRDATRHHLLTTAAKKLRNLANENQKLVLRLSAVPTTELHGSQMVFPCGMDSKDTATTGVTWSTKASYEVERLLSMEARDTVPRWVQSPAPFHGHGRKPYDMALGSSYQGPPAKDIWRSH